MRTPLPRAAVPLCPVLLVAACLFGGVEAGCAARAGSRGGAVPLEIGTDVPPDGAYAVHVVNREGQVRVDVAPGAPLPEVRGSGRRDESGWRAAPWIAAAVDPSPLAPVLRVLADDGQAREEANVEVTVPASAGVTVRNAGGSVSLRGVAGSIDVQNGGEGVMGGDVWYQPGGAVDAPVLLRTASGRVTALLPAGSRGRIEARGAGGVRVVARGEDLREVREGAGWWSARLGAAGESTVVIDAGAGDVLIELGR